MTKQITIVDYGLGNILSAQQSFIKAIKDNNIDAHITISNNPEIIKKSSHVVLPGQGAFETCMKGLSNISGMIDELYKFAVLRKKPFLGICVGMQLLALDSEENGKHKGLGWIEGHIKKLPSRNLKMPHMGWNTVKLKNNLNSNIQPKETDYYFVHSYYFKCLNEKNILAETVYGINFTSIVVKENIYGVQFHPEKSSLQGLEIIRQFAEL